MTENTLNHTGEYDALEKAEPDELIFPLLGRDVCAPPTIMFWVDLRRKKAGEITDPDKLRDELKQCTHAEFIAHEMISRQQGQGDAVTETKPTGYNEIELDEPEVDKLIVHLRSLLSEADFFSHEVLDLMKKVQDLDPSKINQKDIDEQIVAANIIHLITLGFSPHRAAFKAEGKLSDDSIKDIAAAQDLDENSS